MPHNILHCRHWPTCTLCPPQTKLGRVADSSPTEHQQLGNPPDKWRAPHGQEVGGEEAGPDSEEEEEPDEYAGLPLWRRALLKKRAEEERKKEEEKERKVGGAEVASGRG